MSERCERTIEWPCTSAPIHGCSEPLYILCQALQAILLSGSVVFATIFRKMILGRGVSVRRLICLGAVMLGLFVAAEPEIFDLPMTKIVHEGVGEKSTMGQNQVILRYR